MGQPQVNYRETITKKVPFNYLHKKQTGGSGQFARVMGFIEPIPEDTRDNNNELVHFEFKNRVVGANIPPEYISSVEKGECRALSEMRAVSEIECCRRYQNGCAVELSCLPGLVSYQGQQPESLLRTWQTFSERAGCTDGSAALVSLSRTCYFLWKVCRGSPPTVMRAPML